MEQETKDLKIKKIATENLKFGEYENGLFPCEDHKIGFFWINNKHYTPVFDDIESYNKFMDIYFTDYEKSMSIMEKAEECDNAYCAFEWVDGYHDHGFGYQIHFATNNKEFLKVANLQKMIRKGHALASGIIQIGNTKNNKIVEFKKELLEKSTNTLNKNEIEKIL